MAKAPEISSARIASIAARGVKTPGMLTAGEIRAVCASVLTQAADNAVVEKASKGRKATAKTP